MPVSEEKMIVTESCKTLDLLQKYAIFIGVLEAYTGIWILEWKSFFLSSDLQVIHLQSPVPDAIVVNKIALVT